MTGEFRFTEDRAVSQGGAGPAQRGSWSKVVVIAVGSCVAAGAAMWAIVPKGASEPPPAAAAPSLTSQAPTRQAQAAEPEHPEYHGPPKFTVQLGESKTGDCPATFTQSIVVRVHKGEAEQITAVAKIPYDKVTRSRDLFRIDSEWSTMLGALPTKRTINLLVIARGPGGKTTVGQEISQPCAGEPVDKPDPADMSSKAARKKMRDMFADDYDFEFDFEGRIGHQDRADESGNGGSDDNGGGGGDDSSGDAPSPR